MMPRAFPRYLQFAAGQRNRHLRLRLPPMPGDRSRGAGAGTAGACLSHAALVHSQDDPVRIGDLHESYIGSPRECGMTLECGPDGADRCAPDVLDRNDDMGVTHGYRAEAHLFALDWQHIGFRGSHPGEWERFGREVRLAHVNRDIAIVEDTRRDQAGRALQAQIAPPPGAGFKKQPGDAPESVAALLGRFPVRIENAESHIAFPGWRIQDQQLVETHSCVAIGHVPDVLGLWGERLLTPVHDDEVVAQAVHLDESDAGPGQRGAGTRCHGHRLPSRADGKDPIRRRRGMMARCICRAFNMDCR